MDRLIACFLSAVLLMAPVVGAWASCCPAQSSAAEQSPVAEPQDSPCPMHAAEQAPLELAQEECSHAGHCCAGLAAAHQLIQAALINSVHPVVFRAATPALQQVDLAVLLRPPSTS